MVKILSSLNWFGYNEPDDTYWSPLSSEPALSREHISQLLTQEAQDLGFYDTPETLSAERLDLYTLDTRYEVLKRNGIWLGTE